jgi:PAS domain S-box-containing protein
MNAQAGLYFLLSLVLTAILGVILAVYARKRRELPGAGAFFWVAVCEALLAFTEILSLFGGNAVQALFWFKMRNVFSALLPVFWLRFALDYSLRKTWISRWLSTGLFVIPFITQIMVWTNDRLHLFVKQEVAFVLKGPFWLADIGSRIPGIWFIVHSFYGMILLLTGLVLVFATVLRKRPRDVGQVLFIGAGGAVAVATGVVSAFNLLPQAEFNPYTPGLGLSFLLFAVAVFPFRFFSRAPSSGPSSFDVQTGRSLAVFLFIFALLTTGLIALGFISFHDFEGNLRTQAESQLSSICRLKTDDLAEWRMERRTDAELLFENSSFMTLARDFLKNPSDSKNRSEIQSWLARYHLYRQYERIFVTDESGKELLSIEESAGEKEFPLTRDSDAVQISDDRVTLLDLHRDGDGPIHLSLIVPVNSSPLEPGPVRFLGMIVMWIDPEMYLYPYIRQWPGPSVSAETLLVRREGNSVVFLNDLKYDPHAALHLRFPLERTELPAVQAALGREGVVDGKDYRGVQTLAAVRAIPESPWALVARMDIAEIYAPSRERLWQTILLLGALIAASGSSFWMVWRRQRLRFFQSRAEAGQKLRDSLERFELANKATFDVVWDWDLRTDALWWNEHFQSLFGYSPEEIEPGIESWTNRIHPEDRDRVVSGIHAVIDGGGQSWSDHYRFCCKDGRELEIFDRGYVTRDASGKPVRMIGAMQDLTERITAEKEAIQSRDLMRYIIEHGRSSIAILDRNRRFLYMSRSFQENFFMGGTDVSGIVRDDMFPDGALNWEKANEAVLAGNILSGEDTTYILNDGIARQAWWECRPWYEMDGSIGGLVLYIEDITERKKANEALRASLKEKEVLLKEIHHRVKNNMQVISSLLNLQAAQFGEGRFREAMRETQLRIRSMALLHEKLYKSPDLSRIDFVEYAETLTVHLLQSFALDPRRIKLKFEMESAFFDIATANPLGLILNELLSNAMKHAFPGNRAGAIVVGLRRTDDEYLLIVRDDGIGIPPGFDLQGKGSFGIQIIDSLVHQLNGTFSLGKAENGSAFEIRFRELRYTPRFNPDIEKPSSS